MKTIILVVFSAIALSIYACNKIEEELIKAKPYQIVGENDMQLGSEKRSAKMVFITSSASEYDSYAQTAIKAAIDIHKKNKKNDLIQVFLVPDDEMVFSSTTYAFAYYALDGKGSKYISGTDQNTMTDYKWLVRAAEQPFTELELQMAILWHKYKQDFPSEDLLSSLSYNREKLVKFIADSLNISEEQVYLPRIILNDYKELDFLNQ